MSAKADRNHPLDDGPSPERLHPAEHRAYRELYASCRQLIARWDRLAGALEGTEAVEVLKRSARRVRDLLAELEPRTAGYGLHGGIAAEGLGARIADLRSLLSDRAVDTGMVMRFAVLDIEHVTTLLAHLTELADARGDEELAGFCRGWAKAMRSEVKAVRRVAVSLGSDPDRAAAPLDDSTLTRAAHRAGWVLGSAGEAFDRIIGPR
ncbi:MAG: hypothetical protein FJW90_10310 [Actinobacteria bacterium]|nr:hypothetical protein [Actinomycetota bacterium]